MKYIIETEMPLTEVYVAVPIEHELPPLNKFVQCINPSGKHELYFKSRVVRERKIKTFGITHWLKPLPVSPMKEVGEENWNEWTDETTKRAKEYVKEFWWEQSDEIQHKLILAYRAGAIKQKRG